MSELKTNVRLAREISANAKPAIDTLLEIYLQWRGTVLPDPAPARLRFAPKLVHPNGQYFPAMVALLSDPRTGEPLGGIQRTFLAWNGKGKAKVEKGEQKMSLDPCRGGVVRVAEPIGGKPLLLGKGVETVLTVMDATGLPGRATLGTSGLANFEPPDDITEVILLAENDGGPNEKALNEIVPVLAERGIKVLIARPPPGLKDFNDLVNGKSGHLPEAGRIVVRATTEAAEVEAEPENRPENEDGQFQLTGTGLSWRKDECSNWKWIAQPFEILGWARDLADATGQSGDWGKLIRFRNSDGFEIERVVTLASPHSDPGAQLARLLGHGHQMHSDRAPAVRRIPRLRRRQGARDSRASQRLA
ncbi:MAG TPA: toprim domain-containing protein [Roseiarcus sp.]|jgi:hypothetical protein